MPDEFCISGKTPEFIDEYNTMWYKNELTNLVQDYVGKSKKSESKFFCYIVKYNGECNSNIKKFLLIYDDKIIRGLTMKEVIIKFDVMEKTNGINKHAVQNNKQANK